MSKLLVFNPDSQPVEALFAKWVKLYVAQAHLDDDAAERFQKPLSDLEKTISNHSFATMQDFFLWMTAGSCFGDFGDSITPDQREHVYAVAMAEANERESLLTAIELHKATFDRRNGFTTDDGGDTDDNQEFQSLCDRELDLIKAVVDHPTSSVSNIALKGRYLAAVQNAGSLGFQLAQAFIGTLMEGE